MTARETISKELNRLARVAQGIQTRYQAFFSLHDAAAANEDKDEMAQRRDELHTVLDALLDNGEHIHRLTNELQNTD